MISTPPATSFRICNGSPLTEARSFDMPFITEVVLAEVEARARDLDPPASVPYFKNNDEESLFLRLRGHPSRDYAEKRT